MKIKKQYLKEIIKECLVEILAEGLGEKLNESLIKTKPNNNSNNNNHSNFRSNIQRSKQSNSNVNNKPRISPVLNTAINEAAGDNHILKSIFEDTANSTLKEMLRNDRQPMNYAPSQAMSREAYISSQSQPEDLFGEENTDKWASLAFSNTGKSVIPKPSEPRKLTKEELNKKVG